MLALISVCDRQKKGTGFQLRSRTSESPRFQGLLGEEVEKTKLMEAWLLESEHWEGYKGAFLGVLLERKKEKGLTGENRGDCYCRLHKV